MKGDEPQTGGGARQARASAPPAPGAGAAVRGWVLTGIASDAASPRRELGREVRVFGLSPAERLRRALQRAGVARVELRPAGAAPPPRQGDTHLVFRGDLVLDERLVRALRDAPGTLLAGVPDGGLRELALAAHADEDALDAAWSALRTERASAQTGLAVVRPAELVAAYDPVLRKVDPPYVCRPGPSDVRATEARVFAASYKGLTDLVTKWVWPLPARAATRWCARRGITPNAVTATSYLLVALVVWLFAEACFGWGLVAAWLMTFLDTVDGKLARVTLTSSRIGGALDHGLDLVHPPVWWWAWAAGLAASDPGAATAAWLSMAIVVGGYLLGRALEGVFLATFGFEIFLWRPFDAGFRTVIARRNPNLLLLTAGVLAGRPALGYAGVALWTVVSNAVHAVRVAQAFGHRRRGELVRPWGAAVAAA